LEELSRIVPGDPQLHAYAGQLAESRDDLELAAAELSVAVEAVPSWRNLISLADVEARAGRMDMARRHMEDLLARNPGHLWVLGRLASLELLQGDPQRAERIYLDIVRQDPRGAHFTNLGLARSLQGRHADAAEAYRRAVDLDPDSPVRLLNLADGEFALGRPDEARRLYSRALDSLDRSEQAAPLPPVLLMNRAQCLARLGRVREAVEATQHALRDSGEDPEVLLPAALVYALAGDRSSALVNAEAALEKGSSPRWFSMPVFGPLSYDPEIQALLKRY
jgi:tetratricopeptide (TPR) repeat protein